MCGSWPPSELPNLTNKNHRVTGPATRSYNSIAWAAGDDQCGWWPNSLGIGYWPPNANRGETLQDFIDAYSKLGYLSCNNGDLEPGLELIAIFAVTSSVGQTPTHTARQLEDGSWTSKLGQFEDISHDDAGDVECHAYGRVVAFMSRHRNFLPQIEHPSIGNE